MVRYLMLRLKIVITNIKFTINIYLLPLDQHEHNILTGKNEEEEEEQEGNYITIFGERVESNNHYYSYKNKLPYILCINK